jgi:hypothetical protein
VYSLASIYTYPDGRQNLTITVDSNPYLIHYMELGYGIVNWVTKGVFLGTRKVYLSPQPDDVLIDDDMWDPVAKTDQSGLTYRLSGSDLVSLVAWQKKFRLAHPTAAQMVLEMPFNGVGAYDTADYPNETLSLSIANNQSNFRWISHTWDHANLDTISQTGATTELQLNNKAATNKSAFGRNPPFLFTHYYKDSMIQPDISGLGNPNFLQAAYSFGIHYILSDTSQPNWTNPTPNAGFYISWSPTIATASLPPANTASILVIPRHPTNLYYNVNTPANWVSEYNFYYGPGGAFATWPTNLNYQQVLDKESSIMLTYLLTYDIDPLMFHQPNLSNYDGIGHSLLGDLLDATVTKYETLFNLPIQTLAQHDIGVLMAQRMAYNASGMTGTLVLGATSNTIALKNGAVTNVTIPITGINYGTGASTYGGQVISSVNLGKGAALTIPGPASW